MRISDWSAGVCSSALSGARALSASLTRSPRYNEQYCSSRRRPEACMTQFDESHDFVVVGSGGGSMCAGRVLREAGKSVLIVEKTGQVGGTTSRSGGVMWIPNNPIMKRDGIVDSDERAATYLDAVQIGRAHV